MIRGPVYNKCHYQRRVNAAITLTIQVSFKSMESILESAATPHWSDFYLSPLFSMRPTNIASVIAALTLSLTLRLGVNGTLWTYCVSGFRRKEERSRHQLPSSGGNQKPNHALPVKVSETHHINFELKI